MSVYGTLFEDKMRRFKGECAHFSFSKCHIYTHDGASANLSTNSRETDNSALKILKMLVNARNCYVCRYIESTGIKCGVMMSLWSVRMEKLCS